MPAIMELRIRACHLRGSFVARDNVAPRLSTRELIDEPAGFDYMRLAHPPVQQRAGVLGQRGEDDGVDAEARRGGDLQPGIGLDLGHIGDRQRAGQVELPGHQPGGAGGVVGQGLGAIENALLDAKAKALERVREGYRAPMPRTAMPNTRPIATPMYRL